MNYTVTKTTPSTRQALNDGGPDTEEPLIFRAPTPHDGARIHQLISDCPPLDVNSVYVYLLLAEHFANSCVVVERQQSLVGFISAYRPPTQPNTLFIWQVAVHPQARGQALGKRMLEHLLQRPELNSVSYIETTVSPSNHASRAMFQSLAARLGCALHEDTLFEESHFGSQQHEAEPLLRIGPKLKVG